MKKLFCFGMIFWFLGCETTHNNPTLNLMTRSQTEETVDSFTANQKIYDGFMNRLDVSGTLQNSKVVAALTDERARVYQWTEEQYQKEKAFGEEALAKKTEVFLSFFVPERKEDDLHKPGTKWKIFLDVNGKRYEGKSSRVKTLFSELMVLYPHHTRFGTPYLVEFPIGAREIEGFASKMTITGPPGSTTLEFSAR
jgi:hypothetical protein